MCAALPNVVSREKKTPLMVASCCPVKRGKKRERGEVEELATFVVALTQAPISNRMFIFGLAFV